jgi:RNA polymerase sigma factor
LNGEPAFEGQITAQGDLTAQVQTAKTDKHTLNTLLHNYMPFIKKCVSGVFFKGQSKADNLTDAMLAFAHSLQTYNPEQGAFIRYAAAVIRNRLINNARKELSVQKHFFSIAGGEPSLAGAGSAGGSANTDEKDAVYENSISLQAYNREEEEQNLRLEIEEVNSEFARWGFSWETLLKKCPKQERSRRTALRIAGTIMQDSGLLDYTLKNRQLPVSRLDVMYPRKALEKYRQYIAALIIITQGNYPYVYSFVPQSFAEEEHT